MLVFWSWLNYHQPLMNCLLDHIWCQMRALNRRKKWQVSWQDTQDFSRTSKSTDSSINTSMQSVHFANGICRSTIVYIYIYICVCVYIIYIYFYNIYIYIYIYCIYILASSCKFHLQDEQIALKYWWLCQLTWRSGEVLNILSADLPFLKSV